jgi:hypothetical protein
MQFAFLCDMEGVIMKLEHYAAVGTHCVVSHVGLYVHSNSCLDCESSPRHICAIAGFCVCVLIAHRASSVKEEELLVIVTPAMMIDIFKCILNHSD